MGSANYTLTIGGMSCASCAARIEKRLNRLDGVAATVNYATEQAHVRVPAGYDPAQLIAAVEQSGYRAALPVARADATAGPQSETAADPELRALRQRFIGSVWLSVPVIVLAMVPAVQFPAWQWLSLTLASPVVIWAGWPFHRAAWSALRHGTATMDTLVSVGTGAAYLWSLYALFFGSAGMPGMRHEFSFAMQAGTGASSIYLETAAGVTMFLLAGRYFEKRSKRRAGAALRALLELGAKEVTLLSDGVERRVPVAELAVGDHFVVRPGEKIAADGVVTAGASAIDAAMLTGESAPIEVATGDAVTGGTISSSGHLVVRATRVGEDTGLAQMARLVEAAQSGKAAAQRLADRISGVFVPLVIAAALATLTAWLMLGGTAADAFTAAVAVLIIACPCALGLATPTALLVGTGRGAQLGILIKGPEVLESTRRIDTVVLDKTGTVTTGKMTLDEVVVAAGEDRNRLLRLVGALEHHSEHPLAQAITAGVAAELGITTADLPPVEHFQSIPGRGVAGIIDGTPVLVGQSRWLREHAVEIPETLLRSSERFEQAGSTAVLVAWNRVARGAVATADAPKPTSAAATRQLADLGLETMLLTGDSAIVARRVAAQLGIARLAAEVLPVEKAEVIRRLQAEGRIVAMVGDGVNDAAALAQADLGIAMSTGADAAIEASDITLVRDDLRGVADAIRLSRRTLRTIQGNLFWAFAYNVAAIPVAALGLLSPMIAGAAMAFSSVFVVGNSMLLRRFHPRTS